MEMRSFIRMIRIDCLPLMIAIIHFLTYQSTAWLFLLFQTLKKKKKLLFSIFVFLPFSKNIYLYEVGKLTIIDDKAKSELIKLIFLQFEFKMFVIWKLKLDQTWTKNENLYLILNLPVSSNRTVQNYFVKLPTMVVLFW